MILRFTTVHENARSALAPPWNNPGVRANRAAGGGRRPARLGSRRRAEGGVKPPHSKVPPAQPFLWQRGVSL